MGSFRVRLWDRGTNFARGNLAAVIDDAANIGVSAYANEGGEFFMTLPWNHPAMRAALDPSTGVQGPLLSHYEASRKDPTTGTWAVIGTGILDSIEMSPDEAVVYGRDYLSLLETTISASNTSYTNALIGNIISDQLTQARAEASSRVNFISMGTISTTSTTATMLTSFQPRLEFIRSAIDLYRSNTINRPVISVAPRSAAAPAFGFNSNAGADKEDIRLQYGGNVVDFLVVPNFENYRTRVQSVGQKREGATLLYSNQTFGLEATYGRISEAALFLDVVDQAALDALTLRRARQLGNTEAVGQSIKVAVNGLGPWDGYDIGDAVRLLIDRPGTEYNGYDFVSSLYTVWGMEWVGRADGSEELFLDMLVKETTATPPLQPPLIASLGQMFTPSLIRNLILNPSFEIDLSGWSYNGSPFTGVASPPTRDSGKSHDGSYSHRAQGATNATFPYDGWFYPISGTFLSGAAYNFSMWVFITDAGGGTLTTGVGSNGTPADVQEAPSTSATGAWQFVSGQWTPTANRSDAVVFARITLPNVVAYDIYIDDVRVYQA